MPFFPHNTEQTDHTPSPLAATSLYPRAPPPPHASIMYIKNMASVITWKHNVTDLRHWAPSTTVGVFCRSTHKSNTGRVKEQKYVWLAPLLSENMRDMKDAACKTGAHSPSLSFFIKINELVYAVFV